MEDDWDLHAVVRGYTSTSTSTAAAATTDSSSCGQLFGSFQQDFIINFSSTRLQDPFESKGESSIEELHELYKPFYRKPQEPPQMELTLPYSPLSVLAGLQDPSSAKQHQQTMKQAPQQPQIQQRQQSFPVSKTSASQTRSKKRKNNLKRVCHVPAEKLSSDPWSWRKYGQKPIKGSPYPRGYYRCSTSKGCMARKQVERHRSDPGMFMVTYTAEHNHPMPTHRNSLAGSTRHKPAENPTSEGDPNKLSETSPAASLSSAPGKLDGTREEELAEAENDREDDDDDFSVSDMPLADDFFVGLEDLTAGEWVWDNFPAGEGFPWLANSAAAGGG